MDNPTDGPETGPVAVLPHQTDIRHAVTWIVTLTEGDLLCV